MKKIPLTQGKFALVDDEDYDWLMQWKWCAQKSHHTYYARHFESRSEKTGKRKLLSMHRVILNVPQGMDTDHRNHNGLDNRKHNLRACSRRENGYNQLRRTNTKSKYRGVDSSGKRWRARIRENGKQVHLGCFNTEAIAARVYDERAARVHRDYVCFNFKRKQNDT